MANVQSILFFPQGYSQHKVRNCHKVSGTGLSKIFSAGQKKQLLIIGIDNTIYLLFVLVLIIFILIIHIHNSSKKFSQTMLLFRFFLMMLMIKKYPLQSMLIQIYFFSRLLIKGPNKLNIMIIICFTCARSNCTYKLCI